MKDRRGSWLDRGAWLVLGVVLGVTVSSALAQNGHDILYRKLEILAEVLSQIENHYVDSVSASDLVYGAARGVTSRLDAHSTFFSPDEYAELISVTEGEYAGIGIEINARNGYPEILGVFDDSPAQKAGLLVGDFLIGVDGDSLHGLSIEEVQQKLRGPVGTKIVLTVKREGRDEAWTFTLIRGWIRVAPLDHRTLAPGLEYVRVKSFARRVAGDLGGILDKHAPKRGLILDLRGNPGGLFDEAVSLCDLFLSDGMIVSAIGKGGRVIDRQMAHPRGTQSNYPLAILIDGGSASAAEIVAGALHDRGRARLFGSRSYGKGSVQSMLDLSDGSGLKLTIARYIIPSGTSIDGTGVEPDEPVEASEDAEGDDTLEAAREWIEDAR